MNKRDREKKDVKRLQLRREAIRVLASQSLAQVRGGWGGGCTQSDGGDSCNSLCMPSKGE